MLFCLITLLVISSILQLSLGGGKFSHEKVNEHDDRVCVMKDGNFVAAQFITSINKEIDPCDDFYEFACGKWLSNNPKPEYYKGVWDNTELFHLLVKTRLRDELEKPPSSADIIPIRQMKNYYKSCMNRKSDGMELIREILEATRGWPMIMHLDKCKSRAMDWRDLDNYYFFDLLMESPFYTVAIEMRSSPYFYLVIRPPSFKMIHHEYREAYETLMMNAAMLLIKKYKQSTSVHELKKNIDDVIAFEEKLYESTKKEMRYMTESSPEKIIQKWNAQSEEFQKSPIDWKMILQRLLQLTDHSSHEYPIIFENIHYFENLAKIIDSTDKQTIVNFIQWKMMSTLLPHTTAKMENLFTKFPNDVDDDKPKPPRWFDCLEKAAKNHAAFYLFISKYYAEKSREAAENLFHELVNTYKQRVETTKWLSLKGKTALKKKLQLLSAELAHTVFHDNEDNINEYFEELYLGEDYLRNFVTFVKHQRLRKMTYWGKINKKIDFDNPLHSDTYLSGLTLRLAPLYVQSPVLDEKLPNYVSYGMVGAVIAHEIGHIFDYEDITELLSGHDVKDWKNHLQCFIDIYDTYFEENGYDRISGKTTLNENVADWNGLKIAFQAYHKMKMDKKINIINGELKLPGFEKYTDEQMFFISYAQIDWKMIFQRLLQLTDHSSHEHPIIFENIHYFENLAKIIHSTDKRTIVNFMQWKMMSILLPHTTVEMEDLFTKIPDEINKNKAKPSRWFNCLEKAAKNHAAFYLFISKYYAEKSRKAAKDLFHELVNTYKQQVETTKWLSLKGKTAMKKNLQLLSAELAHKVFHDNEDNINEYFEELYFDEDYLKNFVTFVKHQRLRKMTYWGKTDKKIDFDNPLHSDTYLSGLTLRLAPLYVQSPVLNEELPNYISYGMVGAVIAHEIGHIFDNEDITELLSGPDIKDWKNHLQCFIDIYDTYFEENGYHQTSGKSTLNENVADWNGLKIAFQAYHKMKIDKKINIINGELKLPGFEKYTDEQMFFISYAQLYCSEDTYYPHDVHSPNRFRISGVVSNIADFAAAFKCPKRSSMNPTKKCKIWTE